VGSRNDYLPVSTWTDGARVSGYDLDRNNQDAMVMAATMATAIVLALADTALYDWQGFNSSCDMKRTGKSFKQSLYIRKRKKGSSNELEIASVLQHLGIYVYGELDITTDVRRKISSSSF